MHEDIRTQEHIFSTQEHKNRLLCPYVLLSKDVYVLMTEINMFLCSYVYMIFVPMSC